MPHLFSCVGMIIVSWTFLENTIDAIVAIAFHDHGGDVVSTKLPKQFSTKTAFSKRCCEELQSLSEFKPEILYLVEKAEELARTRHYVAHGVLTEFDPADASFVFLKIDTTADKRQHVIGHMRILGTALVKAGTDVKDLAKQGQSLTQRLLGEKA